MPRYPRSTKELGQMASIQVDLNTPIRLYFRSADLLIKQARVYKMEKDYEHAYVLYMKYTTLGLKELPRHPEYKAHENKKARTIINKNCLEALDALEVIKPILDNEYQRCVEQLKLKRQQERKLPDDMERHLQQLKGIKVDTLYGNDSDSIRKQKQEEEQGNDNEGKMSPQQWSLQNALKDVAGVGYSYDVSVASDEKVDYSIPQYPNTTFENRSDGFSYQPIVSMDTQPALPPKPRLPSVMEAHLPPAIPPKLALIQGDTSRAVPALPPKVKLTNEPPVSSLEIPDVSSGVTTERGEPLRKLIVPAELQQHFLTIAKPNTVKNIETCGILAGTLKSNVLRVTTLIIPKQTGTSDTCTTENEEELFEYQDTHDLLTFGWIHTHPSQSCFLSSVDLHTHCSYQLMLPEAIAIVCAPKHKPSYGVFRLTDPPGLDVITNCKIERAFHVHPDLPIYTDTHSTSHVHTQHYSLHLVDLRS